MRWLVLLAAVVLVASADGTGTSGTPGSGADASTPAPPAAPVRVVEGHASHVVLEIARPDAAP